MSVTRAMAGSPASLRSPGGRGAHRVRVRCAAADGAACSPKPPRAAGSGEAGARPVPQTQPERVSYSFGEQSTVVYGPPPQTSKPVYEETPLDHLAIALFTRKLSKTAGVPIPPQAWKYDSFVQVSRDVVMGRTPRELWQAVVGLLLGLMPPFILPILRKVIRPVKWVCEGNAIVAVQAFGWLVGPMERREVEVNGEVMLSSVKIQRCRYLEESGCVGQCVNVCKLPTQTFFNEHFGVPLHMKPNFEDGSCEMIFGQSPPPLEQDEALSQACLGTCSNAVSGSACHKLAGLRDAS